MKPQKLKTPGELRHEFEKQRVVCERDWSAKKITEGLQRFSEAIAGLHEAGIPVSVSIQGYPSEDAFSLIQRHLPTNASFSSTVFGTLTFGPRQHLFSFLTGIKDAPALRLFVSTFDYPHNGMDAKIKGSDIYSDIRSKEFDLLGDEHALAKFQEYIVFLAARDSVVAEHDKAGVFNNDGRTVILKKAPKPA